VLSGLVPVPTYRDQPTTVATDLSGIDLGGAPAQVAVVGTGRWTLIAFLSSGCLGCLPIWAAMADPAAMGLGSGGLAVAVTKDPGVEDVEALRGLVGVGVRLVMSSAAWGAYRVQGPPFFALVDGRGGAGSRVATEGVAWGVEQIADDVRRARERS
jgi:hypothetical protein